MPVRVLSFVLSGLVWKYFGGGLRIRLGLCLELFPGAGLVVCRGVSLSVSVSISVYAQMLIVVNILKVFENFKP